MRVEKVKEVFGGQENTEVVLVVVEVSATSLSQDKKEKLCLLAYIYIVWCHFILSASMTLSLTLAFNK